MVAKDGSTVVLFSDTCNTYAQQTSEDLDELFKNLKPDGLTNLYEALDWTFKDILKKHARDPTFRALVIVFTDGEPYMGISVPEEKDEPPVYPGGEIPAEPLAPRGFPKGSEQDKVARLIAEFTREMQRRGMHDKQVGVSSLQIGTDVKARKFLSGLDNNLKACYGAVFDIVDTKNFDEIEEQGIVKCLLDAFND